MGGVLAVVPKPPIAGFAAGDDGRPHRTIFHQLDNMLVRCGSKMRPQGFDQGLRCIWGFFQIGLKGKGDKPPGVVVIGAVVIALVEFVQANGKAQPKNPAFQIGLSAVVD
jgi:hypothetical protein